MIQFDFGTLLMCILTSNLLIMLGAFFLSSKKLLVRIGYPLLGGILILVVIRLLLPYELPFTKTFWLPESVSSFISVILFESRIPIHSPIFSVWDIFIFIWIGGSFVYFIRFLYLFFSSVRNIKDAGKKEMSSQITAYYELLSQICEERGKKNNFRIVLFPDIQVPMYFHYKKPYIIMPQNFDCSQEDLYFIFSHEMNHHFHHDLVIKYFVTILSILYWWNPFCRFLKKECDAILEMCIDNHLTKGDPARTTAYLNCLINIAKREVQRKQVYTATIPLCGSEPSVLLQRCRLLIHHSSPKNMRLFYILLSVVLTSVFATSFLYNFNASSTPAYMKNDENLIIPDAENTYAVQNRNGSYDIYLYGEYCETVDSLEFYPDDVPIYEEDSF